MNPDDFRTMLTSMADGWTCRDYKAVADNFALDLFYSDSQHYSVSTRDSLLEFFNDDEGFPQKCVFHNAVFDESAQQGAAEYTYEGTHVYHGTVWITLENDKIVSWREYQYISDKDWEELWRKQ